MPKNSAAILVRELHHVRCGNESCRAIILPGQKIWTATVLDEQGLASTQICCCPKCAVLLKQRSVSHYEKIAAALKASPVVAGKLARPTSNK